MDNSHNEKHNGDPEWKESPEKVLHDMTGQVGYCIIAGTLVGPSLWITADVDGVYPDMYDTLEEARKAIIENQIDKFEDYYLSGDCEWEHLDMEIQQDVGYCEITKQGKMTVWDTIPEDVPINPIIETTLQEWRDNL